VRRGEASPPTGGPLDDKRAVRRGRDLCGVSQPRRNSPPRNAESE